MTERRPAQTIGELDVHLSHVQSRLAEMALLMQTMATKNDVTRIESAMSQLATKAEVAAEIHAIREEVNRIKPANILRQFVLLCAAVAAVGALFGLLRELVTWADRVPK
jgi:hypothetical protein